VTNSLYAPRGATRYRPTVCPSATRVIHIETVESRIKKFSPYGSPITLVFEG